MSIHQTYLRFKNDNLKKEVALAISLYMVCDKRKSGWGYYVSHRPISLIYRDLRGL